MDTPETPSASTPLPATALPATTHAAALRHFITTQLGFDLVGFAPAERMESEADLLKEWLGRWHHSTKEWIARNNDKRRDVRKILTSAH